MIDRSRENEQVVVKRTGPEIDVLRRQVLLNARENISLCRGCMETQQYQNDRSEGDSKKVDDKTDEPQSSPRSFGVPRDAMSDIPSHVSPVPACVHQSIRLGRR